jgi:hypothetical protein
MKNSKFKVQKPAQKQKQMADDSDSNTYGRCEYSEHSDEPPRNLDGKKRKAGKKR